LFLIFFPSPSASEPGDCPHFQHRPGDGGLETAAGLIVPSIDVQAVVPVTVALPWQAGPISKKAKLRNCSW